MLNTKRIIQIIVTFQINMEELMDDNDTLNKNKIVTQIAALESLEIN